VPSPTIIKGGDLIGKAEKQMKSVGRYHFGINYNAIEGHIITAEKTTDGMLYLYDAQSGNFITIDEFREAESFGILKVHTVPTALVFEQGERSEHMEYVEKIAMSYFPSFTKFDTTWPISSL